MANRNETDAKTLSLSSEIRKCRAQISGVTPYSPSRYYGQKVPKGDKETHGAYEERTWRNRMHVNSDGLVYMPAMGFKLAVEGAGAFLSVKIDGQGKKTWTKRLTSGLVVLEDLVLAVRADDVPGHWFFVPSDGRRGGGKRVMKCFPVIMSWGGVVEFILIDPMIPKEIFETHVRESGKYVGVGRFRPANGGDNGRFEVKSFEWAGG